MKKTVQVLLTIALMVSFGLATLYCSPPPPAESGTMDSGDGYVNLIKKDEDGKYNKHGWNHYGPGYFVLDQDTGILKSHGGMGLFWYSEEMYGDFVLEMDFMTEQGTTNSGVFFRVPYLISSNQYIYDSFEIQIYDSDEAGMEHYTGAIYDANPPSVRASKGPGEWNHYKITCKGLNVTVELNGTVVNEWVLRPAGKVATCWPKGYIGLQNHDDTSSVMFKNIKIKKLD